MRYKKNSKYINDSQLSCRGTSLRKELPKLLEKHNEYPKNLDIIWAYIDFSIESHRQTDKFLVILKNELQEKYGVKFHLFDIGYATYWRKINPQIPLLRESYSEESIVADLLDFFGGFVSINYSSIKKVVESAPARFKEWTLKREMEIANLVNMEAADLEKNLPAFWASDLADYLKYTSSSAVIFIDTYEALWENHRGQGNFNSKDKWIRDLVAELPGVLWVICGREALRWKETNSDWEDCLEQHHIEKLPDKNAVDLLNLCGVENEKTQKVILDGSKGVPYYLDLAIDTYNQIKKKRQPVPDDFVRTRSEVFDRFIKYLDKQETETLKVLSAPRFWDYYLFEALVKKFNTGYPLTAFSDLGSFSFTSQNSDGRWHMHQLMKESLQEYQDPELKERVHRFIFEYYNNKLRDIDLKNITEEHKNALLEGFYHGKLVLVTSELFNWFNVNSEFFDKAGLWFFLFPLYEEMLQMLETKLPPEHPDIATILNSVASLYRRMGKYKDSLPLYQRSLEIREKVLGPEHPEVATTLDNMAVLHRNMGEYENALPLYQRALEIREKMLGPKHLDVAKTLNNMAVLYRNMGKYEKSLLLYQQSLEIREKVLGQEHPAIATTLANMAVLYKSMGEYDKALLLYLQSLGIKEKMLGKEHPSISKTLSNISVLYNIMGNYTEALSLCQRALEIKENAFGPNNYSVAITLSNLADIYRCMGIYEKALPLCRQALHIKETSLGPLNPSVAITLNILAELYKNNGKYEEALNLIYRALEIQEKVLEPEHPEIASTLNVMAGIYGCRGEYEKALLLYQKVLDTREKVLGPEHPNVIKTLSDFAELSKNIGEYEKALLMYQRALDISEKVLGPEHPDVKTILKEVTLISQKESKDPLRNNLGNA